MEKINQVKSEDLSVPFIPVQLSSASSTQYLQQKMCPTAQTIEQRNGMK